MEGSRKLIIEGVIGMAQNGKSLLEKLDNYKEGRHAAKKLQDRFMGVMMHHELYDRAEEAADLESAFLGYIKNLDYAPPLALFALVAIVKIVSAVTAALACAGTAQLLCYVPQFCGIASAQPLDWLSRVVAVLVFVVACAIIAEHVYGVEREPWYVPSSECLCAAFNQFRVGCLAKVLRHQDVSLKAMPVEELRELKKDLSSDIANNLKYDMPIEELREPTDKPITRYGSVVPWQVALMLFAAVVITGFIGFTATISLASSVEHIVRISDKAHAIIAVIVSVCVFAQTFAILVNWHSNPPFGVVAIGQFFRWQDERLLKRVERVLEAKSNNPAPRRHYH